MKYFCVSDIHSHFNEYLLAVNEAGFDPKDENHKLIVLGDLFDRGSQTVDLLEYMYDLYKNQKVIFIMGNHDKYLLDFLSFDFTKTAFNFVRNGHLTTIEQLLGRKISIDDDFSLYAHELNKKYPYLKDFLSTFVPFYELEDYIFAHGGIDTTKDNFRTDDLHAFMWTRMIDKEPLEGKIIVVGHTPAYYARSLKEGIDRSIIENNATKYQYYYDILDEGQIIHIDGGVYSGGKINVYMINQ